MEQNETPQVEEKMSFIARLREGDPEAKKTAMIYGGAALGLLAGVGVGILVWRRMNVPTGTLELVFEPAVEVAAEVTEAAF